MASSVKTREGQGGLSGPRGRVRGLPQYEQGTHTLNFD